MPSRFVLKYYAYAATSAVAFYSPILYLFFRSRGLSYTEIAIVEGAFMVAGILSEVPSGYVGDRIGWRWSLLVGTGLISVALFGMGLAHSVLGLAALHVVWSVGHAFKSGSDEAWLYETLRERLDTDEYTRVRGRAGSVGLIVGIGASLLGAQLGDINLAYPFFVAGAVTALGIAVLYTFPKTAVDRDDELGPFETLRVVRTTLLGPRLRWFVASYIAFIYLVTVITIFVQPVTVDLGVSVDQLGYLYAALSAVGAVLSYFAEEIRAMVGFRRWFLIAPVVVGGTFLVIGTTPLVIIPGFLLAQGLVKLTRVYGSQYLNDHIESVGRATLLSSVALLGSLAGIGVKFVAGLIADNTSPTFAIASAGVVLLVITVSVYLGRGTVVDEDQTTASVTGASD